MVKKATQTCNENFEKNQQKILDSGLVFLYKGYGKSLYLCPKCNNKMWIKRKALIKNTVCRNCMTGQSFGEELVIEILNKYNIKYQKEKTFKGLKGVNKGILRFDFYIIGKQRNFILEVDGEQHRSKKGWGGNTIIHDKLKDQFCIDNEIPLYRLVYKFGKVENLKQQLKAVLINEFK